MGFSSVILTAKTKIQIEKETTFSSSNEMRVAERVGCGKKWKYERRSEERGCSSRKVKLKDSEPEAGSQASCLAFSPPQFRLWYTSNCALPDTQSSPVFHIKVFQEDRFPVDLTILYIHGKLTLSNFMLHSWHSLSDHHWVEQSVFRSFEMRLSHYLHLCHFLFYFFLL